MAALMQKSSCVSGCVARPVPAGLRPRAVRSVNTVRAQAVKQDAFEIGRTVGLASVAASWMMAGNANAAVELSQLAVSDNRLAILATLFVPALGWVAFNIAQPLGNQLERMGDMKKSVATAVGLGAAAALMMADSASASTEIAQVAASDGRLGVLATLFVPALGWVAFNIAQPLTNQLERMDDMKKSIATAVGLGSAAALMMADSASASTEIAQVAASDGRLGVLATLFVPALGWVAFNIAQPLTSQLERMGDMKKSIATAVGLGAAATLLAAESASASTEIAQLAASDNRVGIIAILFVPALGWVAFNIAQPFFNQLDRMDQMK